MMKPEAKCGLAVAVLAACAGALAKTAGLKPSAATRATLWEAALAMLTVAAFAVWVNAPTKEERGLTAEAKGGAIAARLRRLERLRQRNAAMLITNQ